MDNPGRILVVEDDADLAALLADELTEAGYETEAVQEAESARQHLDRDPPDLILCDLWLPGTDGVTFLREVTGRQEPPAFILITAFGTIPQAVEALKAGADDFLTKPLDLDHLLIRVRRTMEGRRLRQEVVGYRKARDATDFHGIIGQSPSMRALFEKTVQLAQAGGPVLVEGESGTGKELLARAIHAESRRAAGPFIAVNCAAIPAELMESELFGHQAGAFTGAVGSRKGLLAQADGGTLFLDEVADMPLPLQATLLRVLQDGKIRPVGGETEQTVDVRVLTATNQPLGEKVNEGIFRADLFYRLETFALTIPPLREREDDLEILAGRFIAQFSQELGRGDVGIAEEALRCLKSYSFPGNVRELRNAMERAVTFCRDGWIQVRDLPDRIQEASPAPPPNTAGEGDPLLGPAELPPLEEVQYRYVDRVLTETGGNKRRAAEILGVSRRTLYRYLERAEPENK
ncbi:mutant NtrC activator [Thiohalorhabdus denitrificans]|uniref:DNA-binding transcriptional response regulator, NtrC family, contains REC, AAA-type ATPase, and a Fis-type DNA-binding domains n=1 Tax=Thiohalorhabdus denitrificans TaxID=381306 RepID=A0A0P9C2P0_9GAMM|nr:sigma-54 dependent transcriptional regulator [Thiohalorhabdus denitrificans]KPV39211.1 mutant NtrC activator [Thiohalorhabdus denitrificans]SCX75280.1 DNA-binding transcriptional response regulator, NtrC family, contains REC, AAA-type ATPase, and a Fis-type DNA-binding domains [Thiohalorhabdus denitrificans]